MLCQFIDIEISLCLSQRNVLIELMSRKIAQRSQGRGSRRKGIIVIY